MKKLVFFAACAMAVASCNQDALKKAEQAAIQQRDSLEQIIAQKDNEINDMMTTLSDIEEGFREITEAQNRVTLAKSGEGTNTTARIKENLQFIQSAMQQNKELINKLKQQVRESTVKGGQLKKIIDNLTQQMETKDKRWSAIFSDALFMGMISAFVGYVFELADGTDVDEFKSTLKDSANLRWNICVEAEELIVENDGNKVFFLMCPKSFEE